MLRYWLNATGVLVALIAAVGLAVLALLAGGGIIAGMLAVGCLLVLPGLVCWWWDEYVER